MFINFREYNTDTKSPLPEELGLVLTHHAKSIVLDPFTQYSQPRAKNQPVAFGQGLLKTGPHQWHVFGDLIGQGSFGKVFKSEMKIIQEGNQLYALATDDIIKFEDLSSLTPERKPLKIKEICEEATHQKKHQVNVCGVFQDGDAIYTVSENRGISLDKVTLGDSVSFDYRISIAVAIYNEFCRLEKNNTVHRDLKPANICYKPTKRSFVITLIDFGLAAKGGADRNHEVSGTLDYLAPEVASDRGTDRGSDLWAVAAILGERIFNAPDVFKYRTIAHDRWENGETTWAEIANAPYCYDGLFKGVTIPADVDEQLLADIKKLLEEHGNTESAKRPSHALNLKFYMLISQRRAAYSMLLRDWNYLENQLVDLQAAYSTAGIQTVTLDKKTLPTITSGSLAHENSFVHHMLNKLETNVVRAIQALPAPQSHYQVACDMLANNISASDFVSPFPDLDPIRLATETLTNFITTTFAKCQTTFTHFSSPKFQNSNSSGLKVISEILNGSKSPLEKLSLLKELGQTKTCNSWANHYNRSHYLFKGRHNNMEILYQRLSGLSADKVSEQLDEINDFINRNTFTH